MAFFFVLCPFHLHGFVGEVRETEEVLASQDGLEFWSELLQEAGHLLDFGPDVIWRVAGQLRELVHIFTDRSSVLSQFPEFVFRKAVSNSAQVASLMVTLKVSHQAKAIPES
jgi:hypothetical protein